MRVAETAALARDPALPRAGRLPLVICAGVFRSGSTWAFNVVRHLVGTARPEWQVGSCYANRLDQLPWDEIRASDMFIVKTHLPDRPLRGLIDLIEPPLIVTIRDPRDSVASWARFAGKSADELIAQLRANTAAIRALSDTGETVVLRYEDAFTNDAQAIRRIAARLAINVTDETIADTLEKFSPRNVEATIAGYVETGELDPADPSSFHQLTHWHPGHLGDGRIGKYRSLLSEDEVSLVDYGCSAFIRRFSYSESLPLPRVDPGQVLVSRPTNSTQ